MALAKTANTNTNVPVQPFWGMAIYTRSEDGTLSGIWNNNGISVGTGIQEEIARKSDSLPQLFVGMYNVS